VRRAGVRGAAAPRQVAGELGDRIVAAVIAAGDVLAEHAGDGRPDREKLAARLRRAARETVEPDVLEALADVALARLVPAPPNGRP
jgi:ribose 1,5-bisphosphokinase PhnN